MRDLGPRIGLSPAMLFGIRSGRYEASLKSWRKLEAAEREAGIYRDEEEMRGLGMMVEDPAPPKLGGRVAEARYLAEKIFGYPERRNTQFERIAYGLGSSESFREFELLSRRILRELWDDFHLMKEAVPGYRDLLASAGAPAEMLGALDAMVKDYGFDLRD